MYRHAHCGRLALCGERRHAQLCLPIWGDKGKTLRGLAAPTPRLGAGGTVPPATGLHRAAGRARAQWEEEGTRPLTPKTQLPSRAQVSWGLRDRCPGTGPAGQGSPDPLLPKEPPPPPGHTELPAQWPLPDPSLRPGLGAPGPRSAGRALVPAPRPSRAELPAACGPGGCTYTHGGTAWQPPMPRPGRPNRGPQALWIPGAPGDGVSVAAARRRRCGDTRECRGTGGNGWSGTGKGRPPRRRAP